MSGEQTQS